jgi:hypothetical protein
VGVMGVGVVGAGLGLSEPGSQAKEVRPEQQATSVRKERADRSMLAVWGIGKRVTEREARSIRARSTLVCGVAQTSIEKS